MFSTLCKYNLFALALLTGMFITGCKKDKAVEPVAITGSWVNAQNRFSNPEYYEFTGDGNMYRLSKNYGGFNKVGRSIYSFSGSQLILSNNASTNLYNVITSGDTLFLNDGATNYLTLLKYTSAPHLSDWAITLTPEQTFIDTVEATGIGYYNGKIYSFAYVGGANKLVEYSTTLKRVTAITPADESYDGVDFAPDGTLWASYWVYAYKFDIPTGTQLFQSSASSSGANVWAVAYGSGKLYSLRGTTLSSYIFSSDSWQTENQLNISSLIDIAYADGYVYLVADGTLYKMLPGNSLPVATYYLPGYTFKGVAYAGNGVFWLSAQNAGTSNYEMVKVTIN